ncbi:MAG: alpha/beta fold hydrolase [Ruminococcaceae bacterium]|nr:alpha/beta fold hydrolase [Oscillospiraceae bacterium]
MKHREYKRINPDATAAILFVHGIVGTPNHFADFLSLVPDDVSVYNVLLDGHGGTVQDFSHTSMQKWENQVRDTVDELTLSHTAVYIVAHSMGTLFAIDRAIENEKVKGLFLLAVPLKIAPKPRMVGNLCKVYFDKIKPDDEVALAAKRCYGIAQDKNPFHYFGWLPRYLELFAKAKRTRKRLVELHTPAMAYQSARDELVSTASAKILKQNEAISVIELENSGHYYYAPSDFEYLLSEFQKFVNQIG